MLCLVEANNSPTKATLKIGDICIFSDGRRGVYAGGHVLAKFNGSLKSISLTEFNEQLHDTIGGGANKYDIVQTIRVPETGIKP